MAAAKEKTDTHLKCVICTENYTDPRTLCCHHTFCRKCISQYLQSKQDAVDSKSIPCPVCRQSTAVLDPSQPVSQWVEQIQSHPAIFGSKDNIEIGTEKMEVCFLCNEKGETSPGRIWCHVCEIAMCDACSKPHSLFPSSRDHDVTNLSEKEKVLIKRKVKCKEHPKLDVEFCCTTCEKAACQTCCILYHRKCDTVVTIVSMIPEMSQQLKENSMALSKKIKCKTSSIAVKKVLIAETWKARKDLQSEVDLFFQNTDVLIKKRQEELTKELEKKTLERTRQLQMEVNTEDRSVQMYQERIDSYDKALKNRSENDMYDLFRSIKTENSDFELTPGMHDDTIVLKSNPKDLATAINSSLFLQTDKDSSADSNSVLKLLGIVVLMINGIETCVVTDENKHVVKLLYKKQKETHEFRFGLDNCASGITKMADNQVAVAVPNAMKIVILRVEADHKLKHQTDITTSQRYCGLARVNDFTFAGGTLNEIHILDIRGTVLTMKHNFSHNMGCSPTEKQWLIWS